MYTKTPWVDNGGPKILESAVPKANGSKIIAEFFGPDAIDNSKRVQACIDALAGVADPAEFMATVDIVLEAWKTSECRVYNSLYNLNSAIDRLRTARGTGK